MLFVFLRSDSSHTYFLWDSIHTYILWSYSSVIIIARTWSLLVKTAHSSIVFSSFSYFFVWKSCWVVWYIVYVARISVINKGVAAYTQMQKLMICIWGWSIQCTFISSLEVSWRKKGGRKWLLLYFSDGYICVKSNQLFKIDILWLHLCKVESTFQTKHSFVVSAYLHVDHSLTRFDFCPFFWTSFPWCFYTFSLFNVSSRICCFFFWLQCDMIVCFALFVQWNLLFITTLNLQQNMALKRGLVLGPGFSYGSLKKWS